MSVTWNDVIDAAPESEILHPRMKRVSLGRNTVNTCNPAVADINGDGLDEIAVPVSEGEADRITLFSSRGEAIWTNVEMRLYHAFHNDPESYKGSHWHYRQPHRHLLTEIADIDADGEPEVLCGDGPITVFDGETGIIKKVIDLNAHIQLWCTGRFFCGDSRMGIIACCESKSEGSFVARINSVFDVMWRVSVKGRLFYDFLRSGDLDDDGADEVVFCLDTAEKLFVMDGTGRIRWTKNVRADIADDSHVDDYIYESISPGAGTQLLTSTGPCLMSPDGETVWSLRNEYDHGQKVLALPRPDGAHGKNVYLAEKHAGRAHLIDPGGHRLRTYDGFTKPRHGMQGICTFLTSSGGLVDWPGSSPSTIAQVEILHRSKDAPDITGPAVAYATLLDSSGKLVGKIPIEDEGGIGWNGPMCCIPARVSSSTKNGFYAITHQNSSLLIIG